MSGARAKICKFPPVSGTRASGKYRRLAPCRSQKWRCPARNHNVGAVGRVLLLLLGLLTMATICVADEADRYDLASISLRPAYTSPSQIRLSACLRAIAFSPLDEHAEAPARSVSSNPRTPPPSTIGIAVGDAGTILRSDDGGDSWWPIETIRIGSRDRNSQVNKGSQRSHRFFGMGNRSRSTAAGKAVAVPFCEFSDVLWTSPVDVLIVGGGYEPVTGISRGVCLISHDAGQSFQLADAHEMPRMRSVSISSRGSLAATGDASEASGINRFSSHDGGQTWVEDILPVSPGSSAQVTDPVRSSDAVESVETPHGTRSVHDLCSGPEGSRFAVTSHGRIFRLTAGQTHWRAVRGQGRQTGILFVAATPSQVPWSIVGRESLQENRRTTIALDAAGIDNKTLDRCRAAACMLGVSEVLVTQNDVQRSELLSEHRPAVVALDDSLPPSLREAWLAHIEGLRTRAFDADDAGVSGDWRGPDRVVLTRPLGEQSFPDWQHTAWRRAWNHASVLRSTALLTGPGALAHDLTYDALMLVAPGCLPKSGVEVATLQDSSGSVRRDVSLSAGLSMTEGQNRQESETGTASHRRLQITTARMNQTTRLLEELRDAAGGGPTATPGRLTQQIEHLLTITASEDRTRLLWEAYTEISNDPEHRPEAQNLLLELLAAEASPASIRRWAELASGALSSSIEQKLHRALSAGVPRSSPAASVSVARAGGVGEIEPATPPGEKKGRASSGQPISPFQIAPVSYESERNPAPRILVPETKQTVWQSTRGLPALSPPASGRGEPEKHDAGQTPAIPARINWDYHPVVMGARGIEPMTRSKTHHGSDSKSGRNPEKQSSRSITYTPPGSANRPLLDGIDDDACWRLADRWRTDSLTTRCVADEEYLYFAIETQRAAGLCLSLDCDGDYFTSLQFEVHRDGARRASVNGKIEVSPVWYAASSGSTESDPQRLVEIAIARSSLPAPVCRVRVRRAPAGQRSACEVMPEASQWYPSGPAVGGGLDR